MAADEIDICWHLIVWCDVDCAGSRPPVLPDVPKRYPTVLHHLQLGGKEPDISIKVQDLLDQQPKLPACHLMSHICSPWSSTTTSLPQDIDATPDSTDPVPAHDMTTRYTGMDSHNDPLIGSLSLSCTCMQITHAVMPDEETMVHVAGTRQYKRAPGEPDAMCFANSDKLQQQAVDLVVVKGDIGGYRREVGGRDDVHLRVERLDLRKQPLQVRRKRRDVHLHAPPLLPPTSFVPPSRNIVSQYAMHTLRSGTHSHV